MLSSSADGPAKLDRDDFLYCMRHVYRDAFNSLEATGKDNTVEPLIKDILKRTSYYICSLQRTKGWVPSVSIIWEVPLYRLTCLMETFPGKKNG